MNELLFFGIIALFTILEGISRAKKKRGGGTLPVPEEWETDLEPDPREGARGLPVPGRTVEAEGITAEGEKYVSVPDRPWATPTDRGAETPPSSSEGLIPADIWEEITAMARGEAPPRRARPMPTPAPPPVPPRERPAPAQRRERLAPPRPPRPAPVPRPAPTAAPHRLHATHPTLGRPVHERLTRLDTPADHWVRVDPDVAAARGMVRGGPSALRRAIILSEVLGPPVSMREETGDPES